MDLVNLIYKNYGGRKMEGIFKSYLILTLLIKQLLLSFFMSPGQSIGDNHRERELPSFNEITHQTYGDEVDKFQLLLQVFTLLKTESEIISEEQELYQ